MSLNLLFKYTIYGLDCKFERCTILQSTAATNGRGLTMGTPYSEHGARDRDTDNPIEDHQCPRNNPNCTRENLCEGCDEEQWRYPDHEM